VSRAFVHRLEQALQRLGEGLVANRAAQPARFLEIRLRKAASGALQTDSAAGLFNFLRSAQPEKQVRQRETSGVVYAFGLRALLAQVHLLHFVPGDLGQVDRGFLFLADAAQHSIAIRISAGRDALVKA